MKTYLLPQEGTFYKANLHCHTTVSDGKRTPEEIKKEYMEKGYSVVAYTDHDVFIDQQHLTDDKFVALNATEYYFNPEGMEHIPFEFRKTCHLCAIAGDKTDLVVPCYNRNKYIILGNGPSYRDKMVIDENAPDFERDYTPERINAFIDECVKRGFFVTYNHPGWSQEKFSDYSQYNNFHAMEMYNGGAYHSGYPDYNTEKYDELLRMGKKIYCVGGDDNHNYGMPGTLGYDSFLAFTMIKAKELTYESIMDSLFKGEFYASQGPEIYDLYYEDGKVHITTSNCDRITLGCSTRKNRNKFRTGETLTSAEFEVRPEDKYIRFTVKDKYGRTASTNAYFVDDFAKF